MKSYEHRIAELEQELKDAWACRSTDVTHLTEEIKAKEEEAMAREAGAYVNAHGELLTELVRHYPEEDFSWMVDLIPRGEEESEEEPKREREDDRTNNVLGEHIRGDPPTE